MVTETMHILLTNDDGIGSSFLRILAEELNAAGHQLSIAAPAGEQSWISRAVSRRREVSVIQVDGWPGNAWAIDGTPTDCVNIALGHLVEAPEHPGMLERELHPEAVKNRSESEKQPPVDVVISGINVGMNCSLPFVLASGTVAGALEAAFWGLPAIAISQYLSQEMFMQIAKSKGNSLPEVVEQSLHTGARRVAGMLESIVKEGRPTILSGTLPPLEKQEAIVHNINFPYPCKEDSPVLFTEPGNIRIGTLYREVEPGKFLFEFTGGTPIEGDALTDRQCVFEEQAISYSRLDYRELGRTPR